MKNVLSTIAQLFFYIYLTYIGCAWIIVFIFSGWQNAVVLAIVGLPFFIISCIFYDENSHTKHRSYGWIYLSPAQNSEEEKLLSYFTEYHTLFTQLQQPPTPLVNISHLLTLTQPYQSADEATWSHYADCVVAQQQKHA